MRVENLADAWGVVLAWAGVLLGAAWALAPLLAGEEFYLHPGALVAVGVGTTSAGFVARFWANIERFGREEGFTAEWYRPYKSLSFFWTIDYYRALIRVFFPSTLVEALEMAGPKVATFFLLFTFPAGAVLGAGPALLASEPPPADAAAEQALTDLRGIPPVLDIAQYCSAQKADGSPLNSVVRLVAASAIGEGSVQVGDIEYMWDQGAQLAEVELVDPADPAYAATLTMKLVEGRWLPCGDLVTPGS